MKNLLLGVAFIAFFASCGDASKKENMEAKPILVEESEEQVNAIEEEIQLLEKTNEDLKKSSEELEAILNEI